MVIDRLGHTALAILARDPEPVVRYRLLRDVVCRPAGDPDLERARAGLDTSPCVQELAAEQRADGSWGPFHSQDTRLKQKILTTEQGVDRALALGLDAAHPILCRAASYIAAVMAGRLSFPDRPEKNDRWPIGQRLFLAATLSLIEPRHPLLDADRALWLEIAGRSFRSGTYSPADEAQAHADLTGVTIQDGYLVLGSRYQLALLGSIPGALSRQVETALLAWLWRRPHGIGYLTVPLSSLPPAGQPSAFDRWLASHELLARLFPAWVDFADEAVAWLWAHRDGQGFWDFGLRPASLSNLPLSSSWRHKHNRLFDWTTRVLALLRRYYG
jgi:hypothetical protein